MDSLAGSTLVIDVLERSVRVTVVDVDVAPQGLDTTQ
jgi:hypothetical protein